MDHNLLGLIFGLASALIWGGGDFSGGMAARRTHTIQVKLSNLGDAARAFFEASYVNRTSVQDLAPMPVTNTTIPTKPVYVSPDSLYNPFGVQIRTWRKRTTEFGNRHWSQDLDTFHVVAGFDGSVGDWAAFRRHSRGPWAPLYPA